MVVLPLAARCELSRSPKLFAHSLHLEHIDDRALPLPFWHAVEMTCRLGWALERVQHYWWTRLAMDSFTS